MQSTMKSAAFRPATTAGLWAMATEAPVERMGTGPRLGGVGSTTVDTTAPSRWRATTEVSTSSGRLSSSARTTAVSPAVTAQRTKWSENASTRCHRTVIWSPSSRWRPVVVSIVVEAGPAQAGQGDLHAPREHGGTTPGVAVHPLQGAGP